MNWKVRLKNKMFWISFIPALLLLIQTVVALFGIEFDFTQLQEQLLAIVNSLFVVLSIVGVVNDPTTKGIGDSEKAMKYEEPR